ncbi:CoA pyrophosphatase, partial [Corynebacterium sp.]
MSQLRPECTPEWLKPALGVDPSQVQELIGNRQASSLNGTTAQVPVKREAAVLMLLSGESAEEGSILLTHRSPSMRSHSGQIAFPGGRRDPGDTSLVDTALREAWEETDLQRNSVTPLEQWSQLHIRATGNPVSPILAHWNQPGEVYPASPDETDDVFLVPI